MQTSASSPNRCTSCRRADAKAQRTFVRSRGCKPWPLSRQADASIFHTSSSSQRMWWRPQESIASACEWGEGEGWRPQESLASA